jgi:predicted enzyme related to lactoylglutathione lyase
MAGKLVHFEIPSQDSARAKQFYSAVFGWEFQPPWGEMDYHMTQSAEGQGGAIMGGEMVAPIMGHLKVYFDSDDIDASIAKVRESGGEAAEKQPIPTVGWWSDCKDTEGNSFSIFQGDGSVPPPG